MSEQPFILGIAGGSASGKTTFAVQLKGMAGVNKAAVIAIDSYYTRQDELSLEARAQTNYDHPAQFEFDLVIRDLKALKQGRTIELPVYDYSLHNRSAQTIQVKPVPLIIVEGVFALYVTELRALYDLKMFMQLADEDRFQCRLARDVKERGRSASSVYEQWTTTVQPGFKTFAEPTLKFADLVCNGLEFDRNVAQEILRRSSLI